MERLLAFQADSSLSAKLLATSSAATPPFLAAGVGRSISDVGACVPTTQDDGHVYLQSIKDNAANLVEDSAVGSSSQLTAVGVESSTVSVSGAEQPTQVCVESHKVQQE